MRLSLALALCSMLIMSCGEPTSTPPRQSAQSTTDDIVVGGVYAMPEGDGAFMISKVLVVDDFAVHLRSYRETFDDVPEAIDTSVLTTVIGHAPISPDGFRDSEPTLVSTEPVSDDELEGYRMYLEDAAR